MKATLAWDPGRSLDRLLKGAMVRVFLWIGGVCLLLGAVQVFLPRIPRSMACISLCLAFIVLGIRQWMKRRNANERTISLAWAALMLTIGAVLVLRAWLDPDILRPYLFLPLLLCGGMFISGTAAAGALWTGLLALQLAAWAGTTPACHRPEVMLVNMGLFTLGGIWLRRILQVHSRRMKARMRRLASARREIKALGGIIPICAHCKKVRDDQGFWSQVETFFHTHADYAFSHGICPDCARTLYPGLNLPSSRPPSAPKAPLD